MTALRKIDNIGRLQDHKPGLSAEGKDRFYEQLLTLVTLVIPSEALIIADDFNGHFGQPSRGMWLWNRQ